MYTQVNGVDNLLWHTILCPTPSGILHKMFDIKYILAKLFKNFPNFKISNFLHKLNIFLDILQTDLYQSFRFSASLSLHLVMVGTTSLGIALLQVLGISLTSCLFSTIHKIEKYSPVHTN